MSNIPFDVLGFTKRRFLQCYVLLFAALAHTSCRGEKESEEKITTDYSLAFNEIMASNRTGIMAEDGNPHDWVEIKNVSGSSVSLGEYSLVLHKSKAKKKKKKGENEKLTEWSFPEMTLDSGQVLLVYASKLDQANPGQSLHASFKIPSEGGRLQIVRRNNRQIVADILYPELNPDQCLRRRADGSYEASYEQSPGYENTEEGHEQYCQLIGRQRKSPLLIWEAACKGADERQMSGRSWIELRNVSAEPVSLKEYALTTKQDKQDAYILPDKILAPGEYYVAEVSKKKFKVGSSETVLLLHNGRFADGLCTFPAPFGVSMGRKDGEQGFYFYSTPSRGGANSRQAYRFITPTPTFTPNPGIYDTEHLAVAMVGSHGNIHYTTDGSLPTAKSRSFKDSILITRNTVIRAFDEGDANHLRSSVVTGTFFLGKRHSLPYVNISVNHNDLFNPTTGIYMEGPNAKPEFPHLGANYWKRNFRDAHLEYRDSTGSFSIDCGLAIFGGFSRAQPKKSFKVKFKDIYGPSELTYDVFGRGKPITLKNMVFRSGSQDIYGVMVRDEFFTSLMHGHCPELLVQDYRPVALHINGEYFGLYYIREKIDKNFVARQLNVSNDSVSIVMAGKYFEEGSAREWQSLMAYMRSHSLAVPEAYQYVCDRLDVLAVADHNIAQIYASNTDMGNVRYVRSADSKGDRKWHVVYYDVDASWATNPSPAYYLRTSGVQDRTFSGSNNILIASLLRSPKFRQLYLERLSYHLHNTISAAHATSVFNSLIETIRPEMIHNCERWPNILSFKRWESNVETFRAKFEKKPQLMFSRLRTELSITPEEYEKYFSDLGY